MAIKLLLADDHAVVRSGLRLLLESDPRVTIVAEVGTGQAALEAVEELSPDIVLMDIGLPDLSGIEATRQIKERCPDAAVVALTIHEDEEFFFEMLQAGASGYVPKRAAPEELLLAIQVVAEGEVYLYPSLAKLLVKDYLTQEEAQQTDVKTSPLTPREREVLVHLADGLTNAEIGELLSISPKTVARHRENLMRKLDLHSRTALVRYAIRKGIIQP